MTAIEPSEQRPSRNRIFFGPDGLPVGWRLLIYIAIVAGLTISVGFALRSPFRRMARDEAFIIGLVLKFGIVLFATWLMAKIEGRTIGDYGLPWRKMFRSHFWLGAIAGFTALSLLLGVLYLCGSFRLAGLALHGGEIVKFAAIYAVAFVLVGVREEFQSRGYLLFNLTTGLGFWPAAVITSILFGAGHRGNAGESWIGVISAGLAGFVFCIVLRKSGDLWMAIGAHAGWDWGESFFYGVADSGQTAPQHLFNSQSSGAIWLSGGSVGPEGSWLCLMLFIFLAYAISTLFRINRYPTAAALATRGRWSSAPLVGTDSQNVVSEAADL